MDELIANIEVAGRPLPKQGTEGMVGWRLVTPGYFEALRIPIVQGRTFRAADRISAEPAMILSDTLEHKLFRARALLATDCVLDVGSSLGMLWSGSRKMCEMVASPHHREPEYYVVRGVTARDATRRSFLVVRTQASTPTGAAFLRDAVAEIDPELPVTIEPLGRRVSDLAARPRFTAFLLVAFGGFGDVAGCHRIGPCRGVSGDGADA